MEIWKHSNHFQTSWLWVTQYEITGENQSRSMPIKCQNGGFFLIKVLVAKISSKEILNSLYQHGERMQASYLS